MLRKVLLGLYFETVLASVKNLLGQFDIYKCPVYTPLATLYQILTRPRYLFCDSLVLRVFRFSPFLLGPPFLTDILGMASSGLLESMRVASLIRVLVTCISLTQVRVRGTVALAL